MHLGHLPSLRTRIAASAALAVSLLLGGFVVPSLATAAAGGDNNAGDVWVDNVGQPPGPGHEMDPHLACADINLWGNNLADGSGDYTIDGWPPSGSMAQAYKSTWKYDTTAGGDQVTDVISVQKLIANAIRNGDAPINSQGFHFKLQFVQDPQKHKTFWVDCPAVTPLPMIDFSHACGFERVTLINSTLGVLTVSVTQNNTAVGSITADPGQSKLGKYAAVAGDVFNVYLGQTLLASDTYKVPLRC